jgi:WYL domain
MTQRGLQGFYSHGGLFVVCCSCCDSYIQERQWAPDQKITKRKDGSIELLIKTSGWYDVKKWILSFGAEAELLEPEALRQEVLGVLSAAVLTYRASTSVQEG